MIAAHPLTMRHALCAFWATLATTNGPVVALAAGLPFVINTWGGPFTAATDAAFLALTTNNSTINSSNPASSVSALDAVQIGCSTCERAQCDGSVGYGGSPDEHCETTLDALIMDGTTMKAGAVAGLRRVRDAIAAARLVLDYTDHTMLAGDLATRFAVDFGGLPEETLTTNASAAACQAWIAERCQPNYRLGSITPDPESHCGPYTLAAAAAGENERRYGMREPPASSTTITTTTTTEFPVDGHPEPLQPEPELKQRREAVVGGGDDGNGAWPARSHDTISMIAIHADGTMAAGTSTNGAAHKVPGRVGDGPIAGSGAYVDGDVGGCGATGDGDIMMRFLPCYQAVESLRRGMAPQAAAEDAVARMLRKYPDVSSGLVVVNNKGEHGGAGSGWTFTYSFRGGSMLETEVVTVAPLSA